MVVERVAGLVEGGVFRQLHREIRIGHRHDAAFLAMNHRDRATPITLARDAPIAQAEIHLALADRHVAANFALQSLRHFLLGLRDRHPVEETRIDHVAVAVIGGIGNDERLRVLPVGADHGGIAEVVFVDEIEVALVMCRAAEDRAGAIFHQHEIGDIDRQLPVGIKGMDCTDTGVEPLLLGGVDDLLRGADPFDLGDELGERRVLGRRGLSQRVIGRDRHEFRAEQRIWSRGEDLQLGFAGRRCRGVQREADQ